MPKIDESQWAKFQEGFRKKTGRDKDEDEESDEGFISKAARVLLGQPSAADILAKTKK